MKQRVFLRTALVIALLSIVAVAQTQTKKPTTDLEKTSYALGADIGKNLKMQGVTVDAQMLARGIRAAMGLDSMVISEAECEQLVMNFQKEMMAKGEAIKVQSAAEHRKEGEAFLSANRKNLGVVTTASGLQYTVVKEGTGKKPKATDTVKVHYRGTLLDGKEFDSSYKRNEPATFPLNRVIPGWTEGVQLMSVGSTFRFFIPADLAYGDRQMGPDIPPGSTLIFEVELLEIK
ncbi:MAG TPA: hypothetical protein DCX46_06595 [Bacteroidetes bacterium]|nr:hypothetical protein [Bacteroidota bacterium]